MWSRCDQDQDQEYWKEELILEYSSGPKCNHIYSHKKEEKGDSTLDTQKMKKQQQRDHEEEVGVIYP